MLLDQGLGVSDFPGISVIVVSLGTRYPLFLERDAAADHRFGNAFTFHLSKYLSFPS
jgi:hypothetical protein